MKEQVKNLSTNLRLNKEILAVTESSDNVSETSRAYQERETAMSTQVDQITKQRDEG